MASPRPRKQPPVRAGGDRVRHLTPAQLCERFGDMPMETLRDWRKNGKGPAYIRSESTGDKATILYPLAAVEAWEAEHFVDPADKVSA